MLPLSVGMIVEKLRQKIYHSIRRFHRLIRRFEEGFSQMVFSLHQSIFNLRNLRIVNSFFLLVGVSLPLDLLEFLFEIATVFGV
jgi:hypothetical protein